MCRGNYRSAWFSSGGYDFVAEDVFGGLKVDGLFLEYDDERSGHVRAAPLRARRPGRRARPDDHQDAGARVQGRAQAADRRGRQVRGHRPALHLRAVRVRLHRRGQRADHRPGAGQARPAGRDRRARSGASGVRVDPLVIADQGHFFTGLRTRTGAAGTSVYGTHVRISDAPLRSGQSCACARRRRSGARHAHHRRRAARLGDPLPAGRVRGVHRGPAGARAVAVPSRTSTGPTGPPAAYEGFVATFAAPSPAGAAAAHPVAGRRRPPRPGAGDVPGLAGAVPRRPRAGARGHAAGAVGLLDRIGPSVLLTHSLGGGFGWLALSECPSLVKAVVAVEPAGPPFVTLPGAWLLHARADAGAAGVRARPGRGKDRPACRSRSSPPSRPAMGRPTGDDLVPRDPAGRTWTSCTLVSWAFTATATR